MICSSELKIPSHSHSSPSTTWNKHKQPSKIWTIKKSMVKESKYLWQDLEEIMIVDQEEIMIDKVVDHQEEDMIEEEIIQEEEEIDKIVVNTAEIMIEEEDLDLDLVQIRNQEKEDNKEDVHHLDQVDHQRDRKEIEKEKILDQEVEATKRRGQIEAEAIRNKEIILRKIKTALDQHLESD